MPSDGSYLDHGLLAPASAGHDDLVSDRAVLRALVAAEGALVRAYVTGGAAPASAGAAFVQAFPRGRVPEALDLDAIARAAPAGGNPVIPLVAAMRDCLPDPARTWVHRGATSQDVLDTAMMIVASEAVGVIRASLGRAVESLARIAADHRDDIAVARTLTQHAVPTTVGARASGWIRGLLRAIERFDALVLPAQLAGAGGTLASFVEVTGSVAGARALVAGYAAQAGLAVPVAPWHVERWPVTELGDALVQASDAMGALAIDITTLSRPEIAEVAEGFGGGSSAMPHKRNPAEAVLIRSAALRAPQLGATLHLAAATAVDERPDGAWHAEWTTLRELLRTALGSSAHTASLCAHLRVSPEAARANLAGSGGLAVSERLALVLGPLIGTEAVARIVADAAGGADLGGLVRRAAADASIEVDVDALLDPARYLGLVGDIVDDAVRTARGMPG